MNNHGLDLHCEMMLEEYRENLHTFHKMKEIVDKQIRHCLRSNKIKVNAVESRIKTEKSLIGKLERKGHKYRMLSDITDILGARIITFYTDEVDKVSALIDNIFEIDWEESVDKRKILDLEKTRFELIETKVKGADPQSIIAKGYTLTLDKNGKFIRNAAQVAPGDLLQTRFKDGTVESVVR